MTWFTKDEIEREFFKELKNLPDRAAAILASSIIEDRLVDALKSRLHDVKHKGEQLHDRMFSYLGPLGTFGTQIDVGFAIGVFTGQTRYDLHTIRDIRNKFAHKIVPKDFSDEWVKSKVSNIKIADRVPIKSFEGGPPAILQSGMNPTGIQLAETFLGHSSVRDTISARNRYIRAAEILSGLLLTMGARPYSEKKNPEF